jgi:hypothetical protein
MMHPGDIVQIILEYCSLFLMEKLKDGLTREIRGGFMKQITCRRVGKNDAPAGFYHQYGLSGMLYQLLECFTVLKKRVQWTVSGLEK